MSPRDTHPTAQPSNPIAETDPRLLAFADSLAILGRHAAAMDNAEESLHQDCFWCETMKMLSRVAGFGEQIRKAERNARNG